KTKRKAIEISQSSGPTTFIEDETVYEERGDSVERAATTATSLDAEHGSGAKIPWGTNLLKVNTLGSGEDNMKLQELMDLCTKLPDRVLDLENVKDAQALEIKKLKKRVKKLERKKKLRTPQLKRRLFKGRNEIDQDEGISWFQEDSETRGRYGHDTKINTASTSITNASINITTVEPVTITSAPVTTAGVSVSTAEPSTPPSTTTTTTPIEDEDLTIAQTLMKMKTELDKEAKLEREREKEASKAAHIVEWDNVQAMMDADYEVAIKLQAEEQGEISIKERSKLFVELMNERKKHFARLKAEEQRTKPLTKAQKRNQMPNYLKNIAGYTLQQFKGYFFDEIKTLFETTMRKVNTFVPIESEVNRGAPELAVGSSKRYAEEELDQESSKRQKTDESSELAEEPRDKEADELSQKELQQMMIIVPEQGMNVEALQTNDAVESNIDDKLWKLQKHIHYLTWKLYDSCGVHHVSTEKRIYIYMLVEKEYPLSRGTLTLMLVAKLLVDQDNEISKQLLRKIFMLKMNIKFREGLLGLKGFLVLLKLMLLVMIVTTVGSSYNYWYPALQLTDEQIRNYCLLEIQKLLNRDGRSLAEFQDLPRLNPRFLTNLENRLIREALDFDVNKSRAKHAQLHSLLNPEQRMVYDKVIESVYSESGIASLLLPGGQTANNRFVIPLELVENSTCGIKQNTHLAELMQQVKLIVLETYPDFITRQSDESYLKERAILTPRNDDTDAINEFMFKKLGGASVTYHNADEIWKASTNTEYQHHLYLVEFLNTLNFLGMPPHALCLKRELPVILIQNLNPALGLCNGTRLIITKLCQFIVRAKTLTGSHIGDTIVIHIIVLSSTQTKWPFILKRNLNPALGLCNGTRLIITELCQFIVQAKILTGSHIGDTIVIHRIMLSSTQTKWPFILKRRQFPLKPCYAMTIKKSQGQSLNYVRLYLLMLVFNYSQLYVALSRVTSPDGLKILMIEDEDS
ncbi:putative ribonuclease H-like domain-containing protein, partial [Tanacetum coccineum]